MESSIFSTVVAGSLYWFVTSSLCIYPHSLSYFNEAVGGPFNGPLHLLGSNLDWGQDLRYLAVEMHKRDADSKVHLAYSGLLHPPDLFNHDFLTWPDAREFAEMYEESRIDSSESRSFLLPESVFVTLRESRYYAISVNLLHGADDSPRDGSDRSARIIAPALIKALRKQIPDFYSGYSILVY